MLLENLAEFINSLRFVDVKIEDVTKCITERIGRVRLHVPNKVDQLCQ